MPLKFIKINTLFFSICATLFTFHSTAFAGAIWFETKERVKINDGSMSQALEIVNEQPALQRGKDDIAVYGIEAPSKWNNNYHDGVFLPEKVAGEQNNLIYIIKSSHSIRYEIKAISSSLSKAGKMSISGAKINLFLYGKKGFALDQNENMVADNIKTKFPFEIIDKKVSTNYWLETGQNMDIQLVFAGRPVPNNTIRLFTKDSVYENFKTDADGKLNIKLPSPNEQVFSHTRDVCQYRLESYYEHDDIAYSTTLTLLVHPKRKSSNFVVGLYTLFGAMGVSVVFVFVKRAKSNKEIV